MLEKSRGFSIEYTIFKRKKTSSYTIILESKEKTNQTTIDRYRSNEEKKSNY